VMSSEQESLKGLVPESWYCIDCGFNTAPGFLNRVKMEKAIAALGDRWSAGESVPQTFDDHSPQCPLRVKNRYLQRKGHVRHFVPSDVRYVTQADVTWQSREWRNDWSVSGVSARWNT
jgi:hypothetical protein